MSEFVIECWYDPDDGWIPGTYREEIVRCRDCKYARKTDAGMDCDRHILCARFNPDGFCAWGERREE